MRIVIAPQEFKGSLTAGEAARAIAEGVRLASADADIDEAPMSDGGAGLVEALLAARGGQRIETEVHDPLMRPVRAAWALLSDGTAAIEMAAASGLVLLTEEERDPRVATTYGTGELIRAALDRGCARIIVGVGGSATIDGGAGAMQALGVRLLDASGADLPAGGAALERLARIDRSGIDPRLAATQLRIASDVTNVLTGPQGAAVMFGPQKGADQDMIRVLDLALARFAAVVRGETGIDLLTMAGSGAAGGLGAGLAAISGAKIEPGFSLVAGAIGLDQRIAAADLVITGEGRLDAQTPYGKTAAGVARMARVRGKRVGIVAGSIDPEFDRASDLFDAVVAVADEGMARRSAMERAAELVRDAAARVIIELSRET